MRKSLTDQNLNSSKKKQKTNLLPPSQRLFGTRTKFRSIKRSSFILSSVNLKNNAHHESIIQVDVLPQRIDPPGIPKHNFSLLLQFSSSLPSGQSISKESK